MKRIISILILAFIIQISYGQACGKYRIKYIGKIKSDLLIENVKLPSVRYLHSLVNRDLDLSFVNYKPINNEITVELSSHLTSHLFGNGNSLLNYYKTKSGSFSIIFIIKENGKERKIIKEIYWKEINIVRVQDENFGNLFEIQLNEIELQ